MGWPVVAEDLLAGPRGRRLCWCVAAHVTGRGTLVSGDRGALTDVVDQVVTGDALAGVATAGDEPKFLEPLVEAVNAAMYWQEPDEEDRVLADPEVRRALEPVARAITAAPAAQWWSSPIDLDRQQYVQWLDESLQDRPPQLTRAAAELRDWRAATVEEEHRAHERPADPAAPASGCWWSIPHFSRLTSTTRGLPGMAAVGLSLVEDGMGNTDGRCWPLRPQRTPRVYEISSPERWSELAARHPLEVTLSRRHDWWKVTGWAGRWVMPDWAAVAAHYDAVHLTVGGYLTAAGRALPAGRARTVLAGWDPDQTYWLTDILASNGPAVRVHGESDEPTSWRAIPESR